MIKCPHCGADHKHLTLDVDVTVTCSIKEDGTFEVKDFWDWKEINMAAHEQGGKSFLFCSECGWDFQKAEIDYDDKLGFIVMNKETDDEV